ncbi:MAG: hypothetical protein JWO09_3242 [Bacteroidetes bacterium]|nr:hypothetical protein [Bacteroidota bacterium]
MNKKVNDFVKTLKEQKLTLALAESITCGLAAQKLATCIGTSDVLKGAVVCYSPEVKMGLLKIPKKVIEKHTPESREVTRQLAANLGQLIDADIYAAITGLASPGGSETKQKPVGTVFYCIRHKNKTINERKVFKGSPLEIRTAACMALYELILEKVVKKKKQ